MTDLIERLSRQNADLSAAAAGWQARALQAEGQLKQLAATIEEPTQDDAEPGDQVAETRDQESESSAPESTWERLRRWLVGE